MKLHICLKVIDIHFILFYILFPFNLCSFIYIPLSLIEGLRYLKDP